MDAPPANVAAVRLRERKQRVLELWEQRVRQHLSAAKEHEHPAIINSLPDELDRLVDTLAAQTLADAVRIPAAPAAEHGQQRAEIGAYTLEQVVAEYGVLQQVLIEVLDDDGTLDIAAHHRISQSIVSSISTAAGEFTRHRESGTKKELRQTGIRFQHMVEAVKDYAIFTLDPDGFIATWNDGCIRMKQYTVEEAVGQHFAMLYPEGGKRRDEPMAHLRSAAIEGRFRGEGVRLRKNGEEFLADVSITPIYDDGTLTGFTKVVQDLTERTALIQERDLSRTDTQQLRADAEYRERFVATLTHDLRSPLAAAKTGADLIALAPEDSDKVVGWASRISGALARADRMLGDLLDASRLHAGERLPLVFAPCDLHTIAQELCAELAERHGDRFRLEADGKTTGVWSADGMRRVLDNLLTNAVKYGDPKQPISVRFRQVSDRLLLGVHNFGTIIPLDEQQRLFEPFQRARAAASSGKQGWGIGLALVKGIVEAHHGVVKAESYPIEGTTFTADLPVDSTKR